MPPTPCYTNLGQSHNESSDWTDKVYRFTTLHAGSTHPVSRVPRNFQHACLTNSDSPASDSFARAACVTFADVAAADLACSAASADAFAAASFALLIRHDGQIRKQT